VKVKEVQALSDKELRVKIAELCGWKNVGVRDFITGCIPEETWENTKHDNHIKSRRFARVWQLPKYTQDLNAMHEAVESLRSMNGSQWHDYGANLNEICGSGMNCVQATARQRAEAFVLTTKERV